jgi:hypothetical protein
LYRFDAEDSSDNNMDSLLRSLNSPTVKARSWRKESDWSRGSARSHVAGAI